MSVDISVYETLEAFLKAKWYSDLITLNTSFSRKYSYDSKMWIDATSIA